MNKNEKRQKMNESYRINWRSLENHASIGCSVIQFNQIFLQETGSITTPQAQFVVFAVFFCQIVLEQIPEKLNENWNKLK